MKLHLLSYFLFLLLSCHSQNATITIHNKAYTNTDSIYFRHLKKTFPFIVKPGENKSITVDISGEKNIGEGGLFAGLYSNGRFFPILFCRRGLIPSFFGDKNEVYFFPNGTTSNEKGCVKPTEFDFFLKNLSGEKIDSTTSDAQYRPNHIINDSSINLYLKFDEFSKKPEVYVYQNGKKYTIFVDHPWDIWNYHSSMYNFYKDGIAKKDSSSITGKR